MLVTPLKKELNSVSNLTIGPRGLYAPALIQFVDKPQQGGVDSGLYSLLNAAENLRAKPKADSTLLESVRDLCAQLLAAALIDAGLALEEIASSSYLLKENFFVRQPDGDYDSSADDLKALTSGSAASPEAVLLLKSLQLLNLLAGEDVTLYEAAEILRISIDTANKHIAKIKSNFGVLTLPAAILYAAEEGLIKKSTD